MTDFGSRLAEERKRLKLNQTDFAQLAGVTKTSQVSYEAGRREPDVGYLMRLEAHGVDAAYILTGERSRRVQPYPLQQCPVLGGVAEPGSPQELELVQWFRGLPEEARRGFLMSVAHTRQQPPAAQQVNGNVGQMQMVTGSLVNCAGQGQVHHEGK